MPDFNNPETPYSTFSNDDLLHIFNDIVQRVPLTSIQRIFRYFGLTASTNAKSVYAKVEAAIEKGDQQTITGLQEIAGWYLNDHFYHGEKAIYFYKLENEKAASLIELLSSIEPEQCRYSQHFPLTIPPSKIDRADSASYLMRVTPYLDGVALIFSTARYYTKRFELPVSKLKQEALAEYENLDELTATSHRYNQLFDIVIVRPDGILEIRVDNPQMGEGKLMPSSERQEAFLQISRKFCSLVSNTVGDTWTLPTPRDLIEVVDNIYHDSNEGLIRLLSFTTANSGAKEIRADTLDCEQCCRSDAYHEGGSKAVDGHINPYRIHVRWPETTYGELRILGTIYNLESAQHPFYEAIITRTTLGEHYEFIRNRILAHTL